MQRSSGRRNWHPTLVHGSSIPHFSIDHLQLVSTRSRFSCACWSTYQNPSLIDSLYESAIMMAIERSWWHSWYCCQMVLRYSNRGSIEAVRMHPASWLGNPGNLEISLEEHYCITTTVNFAHVACINAWIYYWCLSNVRIYVDTIRMVWYSFKLLSLLRVSWPNSAVINLQCLTLSIISHNDEPVALTKEGIND